MIGVMGFVLPAQAQRTLSRGGGMRPAFVHRGPGRFFPGLAFAPYYYPDYDSEPGMIEAAQPPVIIMPIPQPASPAPKPAESLVLELHGDHWVRITNYGQSQTDGQSPEPQSVRGYLSTPRQAQAIEPARELPAAVLVFRDGHKEEVGKYMIMGATIYASADYWSLGSWTRKVRIADLDVPATLRLNQERGAKFSLPSGPYEVMIRP
jgi:hypothetical protein